MSDEHRELIEKLRDASSRPTRDALHLGQYWNLCDETADALEALVAERDALKKRLAIPPAWAELKRDAERYRWLRANQLMDISDYGDIGLRFDCDFENYDDIDAVIDAAMQEKRR